jgi:hypothetical protein
VRTFRLASAPEIEAIALSQTFAIGLTAMTVTEAGPSERPLRPNRQVPANFDGRSTGVVAFNPHSP